jgi:hypothetical protein
MSYKNWKDDPWYVLNIAKILKLTPQEIQDQEWSQIQEQLGCEGIYLAAYRMTNSSSGNAEYYTQLYLKELQAERELDKFVKHFQSEEKLNLSISTFFDILPHVKKEWKFFEKNGNESSLSLYENGMNSKFFFNKNYNRVSVVMSWPEDTASLDVANRYIENAQESLSNIYKIKKRLEKILND